MKVDVASFFQETNVQGRYQDTAAANFPCSTFSILLFSKSKFFWILPLKLVAGSHMLASKKLYLKAEVVEFQIHISLLNTVRIPANTPAAYLPFFSSPRSTSRTWSEWSG